MNASPGTQRDENGFPIWCRPDRPCNKCAPSASSPAPRQDLVISSGKRIPYRVRNDSPVGQYPTWRTVRGVELVYGRHDLLSAAAAERFPLEMADRTLVTLEHCTEPDRDNYAIGWPIGTYRPPATVTQVGRARHRSSQRPRHGRVNRSAGKAARYAGKGMRTRRR